MSTSRRNLYIYAALMVLAVLAVYVPGLQNGLVFDDLRLTDGTIFGEYNRLLQFKQRILSYGSFVWIQELLGQGWWKQRLVNILLHLGVLAALYGFLATLLRSTSFPHEFEEHPHFERSRTAALQVGIALFALNPVAVYAVAYLAQRSIVMATFFAVLACWMFVHALQTGKASWFAGAFVSYVLAMLSKEYAVMTAALAVPLYIHIRRPSWKNIILMAGISAVLLFTAIYALWKVYGGVIGHVFDEQSLSLARQLEILRPGISEHLWALSIFNEARLFLAYGLLWIFPNVQWMSIDLRPSFPLGFGSLLHLAGAAGYLAVLLGSIWLIFHRNSLWRLVALLLLFPSLWYLTEFTTVWVQDPFVLYRSYLWAVALPGLIGIILTGFKPKTIYVIGIVLSLLFGALALERVTSLKDSGSAWGDAAEKIGKKAPPNAIGGSRSFLNLGTYHVEKGLLAQALHDFTMAESLGDSTNGGARYSSGIVLQLQKKHAEALKAFDSAQSQGYSGIFLDYHRGESAFALGKFSQAYESYHKALDESSRTAEGGEKLKEKLRLRLADSAIGINKYDTAIEQFNILLKQNQNNPRLELGLAMALEGNGEALQAIAIFDKLVARGPNPVALYGRALAYRSIGNVTQSLKDINEAIRLDPRNPEYRAVQHQIQVSSTRKPDQR